MAVFQAFLCLSSLLIHATADCQSSTCSSEGGGVSVRFPFGLENHQSFMSCAYNPLYSLKCSSNSSSSSSQHSPVVFNLPSSGDFFVRNINYLKQEIQLYDPSNCLPKRFLKLDLSFSPFKALNYSNFTFLRCPKHAVKAKAKASFSVIDCLSNSTVSVLATSSLSVVRAMNMCEPYAANVRVPVSLSGRSEDWFFSSSDLTKDFRLRWSVPDCRWCEVQGGVCAFAPFADYTIQDIGCSFGNNASTPTGSNYSSMKKGTRIFWIIVVCVILPGVAFMSCMWCLKISGVYITKQMSRRRRYYSSNSMAARTIAVHNPPEMATVFEDNGSLPRPGTGRNNSCTICLQDYQPEQRARLMQGCQHSFHAHCLEQWLEFNSRCPACWDLLISSPEIEMATARTSPTPQATSSSSLTNSMAMATEEQSPEMVATRNTQTLYTPKVFVDSEWLPRPGETSCAICRDKYLPEERLGLVNGCQHSFHSHCLESWLETSPTCPLCRNSLSS